MKRAAKTKNRLSSNSISQIEPASDNLHLAMDLRFRRLVQSQQPLAWLQTSQYDSMLLIDLFDGRNFF